MNEELVFEAEDVDLDWGSPKYPKITWLAQNDVVHDIREIGDDYLRNLERWAGRKELQLLEYLCQIEGYRRLYDESGKYDDCLNNFLDVFSDMMEDKYEHEHYNPIYHRLTIHD